MILDKIFSIKEEQKGSKNYCIFRILGVKFKKRIKENHIYLIKDGIRKEVKCVKGIDISFEENGSVVEIGANPLANFKDCQIVCGNNSFIHIGSSVKSIRRMSINSKADGSRIIIGDNFSSQSVVIINENEPNLSITIGEDCMFSNNIYIRPTDAHTIYDIKTGEVLNPPCDITIGNHVWSGRDVKFLKGAKVPDNFVVGANSIVTKKSISSEMHTGGVLAGIPAKVMKTGCTWSPLSTYHYLEEKQHEVSDG